MGYRSDVAVAMRRSFFAKVMETAPDAVKELVDCADTFRSSGDSILLAWSCMKWYTDGNSAPGVFHRAILKILHSEEAMDEDYLLVPLLDISLQSQTLSLLPFLQASSSIEQLSKAVSPTKA